GGAGEGGGGVRHSARLEERDRRPARRSARMAPPLGGRRERLGSRALRALLRAAAGRARAPRPVERERPRAGERSARAAGIDRSGGAPGGWLVARHRPQDRQGAGQGAGRRRRRTGPPAPPVRARLPPHPGGAGGRRTPLLLHGDRRLCRACRPARRRGPKGDRGGRLDRGRCAAPGLLAGHARERRVRVLRLSPGVRPLRGDPDPAEASQQGGSATEASRDAINKTTRLIRNRRGSSLFEQPMKKTILATALLALVALAAPRPAAAGVSFFFGLPVPGVSVFAGPPVAYAPPPVVYAPPVYAPPVYYGYGRPYYYGPAFYGRRYYRGWGRGNGWHRGWYKHPWH